MQLKSRVFIVTGASSGLGAAVTRMIVSPNTPADKAVNDPVGTGPFKLSSFTPQTVVLEAFDGYWGEKPAIAKASYVWRPESSIRAAMPPREIGR